MTAEIAILNRTALAFAADSAVTISVGDKRKTYDTAEKLFEFCRKQPIALMIYNNVEFVGVPLDVLIRKFRAEEQGGPPYQTMREAAEAFLEYLRQFQHDLGEEKRYLFFITRHILKRINDRLVGEVKTRFAKFFEDGAKGDLPGPDDVLLTLIKEEVVTQKASQLKGFLPEVTLTQFRKRFTEPVERAFADVFKGIELTKKLKTAVTELSFHIMRSSKESPLVTGLVFGGFAEKDMFPTLRSIEIDGVFFDQLKVLSVSEIDIDRRTTRAEVVPFAQKEMVERFIYGLDSGLQGNVQKFVGSAIDEILNAIDVSEEEEKLKGALKQTISARFSEMLSQVKERSRRDLIDIVYFMSKKEIADIAFALVELTSQKRRFSTDEQSVGGPIDVAVITKSEGLIWIRRKHYFERELNQAYLARTFNGETDEDGSKAARHKAA